MRNTLRTFTFLLCCLCNLTWAQEVNFGIKGFNLNQKYEKNEFCSVSENEFNFYLKPEFEIVECKEKTSVLGEDFISKYKKINDEIYEVTISLDLEKINQRNDKFLRKDVIGEFWETGKISDIYFTPEFKVEYSEMSNLIVQSINEKIGLFSSRKKTKQKTDFVKKMISAEPANNPLEKLFKTRSGRQEIAKVMTSLANQGRSSEVADIWERVLYLQYVNRCEPNCMSDKYTFEWKKKNLFVSANIFLPEYKQSITPMYQIDIHYYDINLKKKVDDVLRQQKIKHNQMQKKANDLQKEQDNFLKNAQNEIKNKSKDEQIRKQKEDF